MDKEKTYEPMNVLSRRETPAGTIYAILFLFLTNLSSGEHVKVLFTVLFKATKLQKLVPNELIFLLIIGNITLLEVCPRAFPKWLILGG